MRGEPIEAVKDGLQKLLSSLRRDPYALESVYLSLITFGNKANVLVPLTELSEFYCPEITLSGNAKRDLGFGLELLLKRYKREIKKTTSEEKGDWLPIVIIMTGGEPDDGDRFKKIISQLNEYSFAKKIVCVTGMKDKIAVLNHLTNDIFSLDTMDSHAFSKFWQWVSTVAVIQSHFIGSDQEILPPPPQEINPFYSETNITSFPIQPTSPPVSLPPLFINETTIISPDNNEQISPSTATDKEEQKSKEIPNAINCASFSPNGKFIVTAGKDGIARIWEAATGKNIRKLYDKNADELTSALFSPDGWYILTTSKSGFAQIWEAATGKKLHRLSEDFSWVNSGAFSPDGKFVVTASIDDTVRIWKTTTGQVVRQFDLPDFVNSVTFSSDVKFVLTIDSDNTARIWDIATGKEVCKFELDAATGASGAFSPDGKLVAIVTWDPFLSIWEAASGKRICRLVEDNVSNTVAFSPNGKFVVTSGYDGIARIYMVEGQEVYTLQGHTKEVRSASFSPDGKFVVTASLDGTARIWGVTNISNPIMLRKLLPLPPVEQKPKSNNSEKSENETVAENKKQNSIITSIRNSVKTIEKFISKNYSIFICCGILFVILFIIVFIFTTIWFNVWMNFSFFLLGIVSMFIAIMIFGWIVSITNQKNSENSDYLLPLFFTTIIGLIINLNNTHSYWQWFSVGALSLILLLLTIVLISATVSSINDYRNKKRNKKN
jgi:WD40 repeat protein